MKNSVIKYDALLMVADSETNANILYATRFFVPDPAIYFQIKNKSYMVLSDLEIDRAKKTASVNHILSLTKITNQLKKRQIKKPGTVEIINHIFKKRKISSVLVPTDFPIEIADGLRKKKLKVHFKPDPFFECRQFKSSREVRHIKESLKAAEKGMETGINLIKKSIIGKDGFLYIDKIKLTSELVKAEVNSTIMRAGCLPSHTIVSCGKQCCDPHNEGSGALQANSSIIFDIFPCSQKSGYFGDLSRTVVKGKASSRLKKAYQTVLEGQQIALKKIKDEVDGKDVHNAIQDFFKQKGFPTRKGKKRMEGFFHGTGHGVGLDVHEHPRISITSCILKAGHVVTVEPGLYYPGMGGVRIEDVVLVTKTGMKKLTQYPNFLEIS
ncbi:MAG: Xaa-Pro peptidase family protein [Nitrospinota bacterium]|jgi:Xaa-Pro aminopeptidase|nr:Xaa-Pro peptidase family protein [Nitrospinota bacterium]MDP7580496.1 Xaa-Pro peptidase family protein [Nitrospinota bacterium]HJN01493.1 Xaa-Pro peptidase family protein [Nitrospinota bacterium]